MQSPECSNCTNLNAVVCKAIFASSVNTIDSMTTVGVRKSFYVDVADITLQGRERVIQSAQNSLGKIGCELTIDEITTKIGEGV